MCKHASAKKKENLSTATPLSRLREPVSLLFLRVDVMLAAKTSGQSDFRAVGEKVVSKC